LAGPNDADPKPTRKLGRGLSEVSHLFLSSAEKRETAVKDGPAEAGVEPAGRDRRASDRSLWLPRAAYLCVTSGDGVRGKTLLAGNLAYSLQARGRKAALVSLDPHRPDLRDTIGLRHPAGPVEGPGGEDFGGIFVIDALPDPTCDPNPLEALEAAAREAHTVVIDASPALEASRAVWQVASVTVVLAEPGSESMRSAYVTVKRIHSLRPHARIGLVLNCVRSYAEGEDCFRKLAEVCRKFLKTNLRNYGYVLRDGMVNEAFELAVPLVKAFPDSKAAKCIGTITGLILMDESAIARRRREVRFDECASRKGRLQALRS
jgi:flagellar biosynthesis protein FlhG